MAKKKKKLISKEEPDPLKIYLLISKVKKAPEAEAQKVLSYLEKKRRKIK